MTNEHKEPWTPGPWRVRNGCVYGAVLAALGPEAVRTLHPATADLVRRFSAALSAKLGDAERKYGRSVDWARGDWMDECRAQFREHVEKGDPRDVAAYCAFLWHHGESTSSAPRLAAALAPAAQEETP